MPKNLIHFLVKMPNSTFEDLESQKKYVNTRDERKLTPLHISVLHSMEENTKQLLKLKAKPELRSTKHSNGTALHMACCRSEAISLILLDHISEYKNREEVVNMKNCNDTTALHYACACDHVKVVDKLISMKADVNAVEGEVYISGNMSGETPLHKACMNLRVDVVKRLLECPELDKSVKNGNSRTPYEELEYYRNTLNEIKKFRNGRYYDRSIQLCDDIMKMLNMP